MVIVLLYGWVSVQSAVLMSRSVLLVLGERLVVIAVAVDGRGRVETGRAVLQAEAHRHQLRLDLVYRLLPEVTDVEQVRLAARDELAHGVDALTLEAVVRPDGELQVLDRQREVRRELRVDGRRADLDALSLDVELTGQAEQLDQRATRRGESITRPDRRLGLDIDDELVEVGTALDASGLDLVRHLEHRRVDRVDRNPPDLGIGLLVLHRRDVASTTLDRQLHLELALAVERGDVQVGVVHLDPGRRRDVRRGDCTRALFAQVHHHWLVVFGGHDQTLQVEDDVGDVLLHPGDRGELVQDPVDPDRRDGRPRNRREQGSAQRVAERVAEARLERLDGEPGAVVADRLFAEVGTLSDEHVDFLSATPAI